MDVTSYQELPSIDAASIAGEKVALSETSVWIRIGTGWGQGGTSILSAGDVILLAYEGDSLHHVILVSQSAGSQENPGGEQQMPGGDTSGMTGGSSGSGMTGTQQSQPAVSSEPLEEVTACTMVPAESVTVSITVDELDVSRLSEGMAVDVTLDALPGQSFQASIAEIATEGENSGGNTKYTVLIAMERTEKMLAGMTASVSIPLEQRTDCLVVPAEAIQELNGETVLYTSYDEKSDTLGDPQTVDTGLSDGTKVEILSGLSSGETFYYRYADTIVYSFVANL